ncbi:MAG: hypothetical protein OXN17_01210 [Candidatus Poribacteria bacterium]|nr:hypothetical protein [Candidatus Poribacteria bacterium]MDE0505592.1 hypothetical protein [Candidatus Poribacteria bacterium]
MEAIMIRQVKRLLSLTLIATMSMAAAPIAPVRAQLYAECCPNERSLKNFEWASITPGTVFKVKDEKLRISNITFNWNMILVDKDVWKDFRRPTDFTIEATFSDIVMGERNNIGWLYVVARYAQENPATYKRRLNMIKWTLDEEGQNNGLYLYQWVDGNRIRPVPGSRTRAGAWINDPKNFGQDSVDVKMVVTGETISVDLWGETELDKFPNDTNSRGRPGVGVWSENGAVSVSFLVYGRKGYAAEPYGKVTTIWGKIKADL